MAMNSDDFINHVVSNRGAASPAINGELMNILTQLKQVEHVKNDDKKLKANRMSDRDILPQI